MLCWVDKFGGRRFLGMAKEGRRSYERDKEGVDYYDKGYFGQFKLS
ncbi:hypothetical protein LINPERPRIM_LOCUS403 [Linum perenne]